MMSSAREVGEKDARVIVRSLCKEILHVRSEFVFGIAVARE